MKRVLTLVVLFLLICSAAFGSDVFIDSSGNIEAGVTNLTGSGNLDVEGLSGEHAIRGFTSGTGAAGVYGENNDVNGYGGYFQGHTRITGDLTVDGSITGETDPTVNSSVKDGVDWTEIGGIPDGFSDGIDNTGGGDIWIQSGSDIYYNSGNIGVGTSAPAGTLDVSGNICLGSVCRSTWPTGSGSGAFTDTGGSAYYNGGNVGIGTAVPQGLVNVDSRVLHIVHTPALTGDSAVGLRLELENNIDAGIMSGHRAGGDSGLFVGTLNNYRIGLGTNSIEQITIATNGNLGIGSPSPLQPLHVQGNAYIFEKLGIGIDSPTHDLQVSGNGVLFSSGTGDIRLHLSKSSSVANSSLIFQDSFTGHAELGLTGDNNFHIKMSQDGSIFSDAMTIDTTGNIGIGTIPQAKLHIVSDNLISLWAENFGNILPSIAAVKNGSGDAAWITHDGNSGNALVITQLGPDPAIIIKNSSSDVMVVESSGNVGVGTSTPQSAFQVNGYTQLALTAGGPPAVDCDHALERGRMKVDSAASLLYICMDSGWVAK